MFTALSPVLCVMYQIVSPYPTLWFPYFSLLSFCAALEVGAIPPQSNCTQNVLVAHAPSVHVSVNSLVGTIQCTTSLSVCRDRLWWLHTWTDSMIVLALIRPLIFNPIFLYACWSTIPFGFVLYGWHNLLPSSLWLQCQLLLNTYQDFDVCNYQGPTFSRPFPFFVSDLLA